MPTMTYEEYLPFRGNQVDLRDLVPDKKYYIEVDKSFIGMPTQVYEGDFAYKDDINSQSPPYSNNTYFNNLSYVVNPENYSDMIKPRFFSAVDPRIFYYEQKYNEKELNQDVENMVLALSDARNIHNKHIGLPDDAATILAINTLDPDGLSTKAKTMKHKYSKGGKRKQSKRRKQRSRKQRHNKH